MNDLFDKKISIYSNNNISIDVDYNNKILYINISNHEYNKENINSAIEYYYNFWLLIHNTDDRYYQLFIFDKDINVPLEFYDIIFKTLKSLEFIYKKNLYSSCVVNSFNIIEILKPIFSIYKSVRPFNFEKTIEEGYKFIFTNST